MRADLDAHPDGLKDLYMLTLNHKQALHNEHRTSWLAWLDSDADQTHICANVVGLCGWWNSWRSGWVTGMVGRLVFDQTDR
jgi:hypothetical protein